MNEKDEIKLNIDKTVAVYFTKRGRNPEIKVEIEGLAQSTWEPRHRA